jgi:TonB family protein
MGFAAKLRKGITRFLLLSAALHILVTGIFTIAKHRQKTQIVQEKITKYYPAMLLYAGSSRGKWTPEPVGRKKHAKTPSKTTSDLAIHSKPAPPAGQPAQTPNSVAAGNGADQQNAEPAFPIFSPRPPISDRSLLPSSSQQVIVDVKVSAAGDVQEATLVKGIGNALDQLVLDTVKTWRFHPATVNGTAVATEAELIFPFDRKYPTTG